MGYGWKLEIEQIKCFFCLEEEKVLRKPEFICSRSKLLHAAMVKRTRRKEKGKGKEKERKKYERAFGLCQLRRKE